MKLQFYFTVLIVLALPQRANAGLLEILVDILSNLICTLTLGLVCNVGGGVPDEPLPPSPIPPAGPWRITLDVKGSKKDIARPYYDNGAARWSQIIQGDEDAQTDTTRLPEVPYFNEHGCTYPAEIDDLYLCVWDGFIDGPGIPFLANTLAFASPWLRRTGPSTTPYVSIAKFDSWDIEARIRDGTFQTVVNHEMGHALGLGSLWAQDRKCPETAFANSPQANKEFQALSGCSSNAQTTSDCGHWDSGCFGNEFFVPAISKNAKISRVTVGALEDLGYSVNYNAADAYTYNDLGGWCKCGGNRRSLRLGVSEAEITRLGNTTASISSNSRSERPRRQLSDAARNKAVADGTAFLNGLPDSLSLDASNPDGRALEDSTTNKFGVVYVEEEGQIYAVHVEV